MKTTPKLITLAAAAAVLTLSACSTTSATPDAGGSAAADLPKVGIVLGGLANDGGFNQYAADAANALESEGLIDAQIRESVATPADAEPIFRQFADEGYDLVVGWGLGFSESVFTVAEELPDTHFVATGANTILEEATDNVETWTYDFNQYGYLTGWVAGKANLSPFGIVDAELAPYNEPAYEALRVGIKETNPAVKELEPIFTGSFDDTQLANQASKALISQGAELIVGAAGANNAGIVSAAKDSGIATIGVSNIASDDAALVNLGVVDIDWTPTLRTIVDRLNADEFGGQGYSSEIANKGLIFSSLGGDIAGAPDFPADIADQVSELSDQLASGEVTLPSFE